MASYKSPGKAHREGLTLMQLMDMFPDDATATQWFEDIVWSGERCCVKCSSMNTRPVPKGKPMPYWCPDCRSYFNVRTGVFGHLEVDPETWTAAYTVDRATSSNSQRRVTVNGWAA